jgi:hypothetical protein
MPIKTIPLSRLEADLTRTLNECADSGQLVVVELPDHRLLGIQSLDAGDDNDTLVDDLLESNPAFQQLVARSQASERKDFRPLSATNAVPRGSQESDG